QDARLLVATLDGNEHRLTQPGQCLRDAPNLDLRNDADLCADVQERPIALGDSQQRNIGSLCRAGGRRGDACAANLFHPIHAAPRVLQSLLALGVVVHDPFREIDGALDAEAAIRDAFAEILQTAAALDVLIEFADPGFDRLIAGSTGDFDFLDDRQLLSHEGGRVQAVAKRLIGFAFLLFSAAADAKPIANPPLAAASQVRRVNSA